MFNEVFKLKILHLTFCLKNYNINLPFKKETPINQRTVVEMWTAICNMLFMVCVYLCLCCSAVSEGLLLYALSIGPCPVYTSLFSPIITTCSLKARYASLDLFLLPPNILIHNESLHILSFVIINNLIFVNVFIMTTLI